MRNFIMTCNSIKYTIDQLMKIANPNGKLKYIVNISKDKKKIILVFNDSDKRLIFNLTNGSCWHDLISEKHILFKWIENYNEKYSIPVLFWSNSDLPFVSLNNNEIIFNGDIVSSSFFMLSRWEETISKDYDMHGRFKYKNSVAYKYGFIDIPIVDEYAMILRKYLQLLLPNITLGSNKFRIKLSHDIDNIRRFDDLRKAVRTFGGDLLKSKSLNLLAKSILEFKKSYKNPALDPYFLAVYELARLSKEYNADSAFYFKTSDISEYDSGYIIKNHVRDCIIYLENQGFEIGFHPGYYTFKDYDKFLIEKERLDSVLHCKNYGGRQHYLRFDINTTWKHWEKAGLAYDSTLGYAEREGFRCGTCHPYKPFDLQSDRELNIYEIPLISMKYL